LSYILKMTARNGTVYCRENFFCQLQYK